MQIKLGLRKVTNTEEGHTGNVRVCIRLYKIKNKDVRKDLNTYSENERRPPA
jgi:hypothetical protein